MLMDKPQIFINIDEISQLETVCNLKFLFLYCC